MKLIPNWKAIALKSHSMWAIYLGIALLVVPELIFVFLGLDLNPYILGRLALLAFAYGIVGRIVSQGIDHSK